MPGVVHRNTFTGHLARQTERSRRVDILGREVRGADSRSAEPGTENRQLVQCQKGDVKGHFVETRYQHHTKAVQTERFNFSLGCVCFFGVFLRKSWVLLGF